MEKTNKIAVVLSGGFCDCGRLKPRLDNILCGLSQDEIFVIAADSGIKYAEPLGLKADTIVGDYDSIESMSDIPSDCETVTVPCEKDDTDTMLASKIAASRGYERIIICGGFGGRIDHFMANLYYPEMLKTIGCSPVLTDGSNFITFINNETVTVSDDCRYFSLFSADEMCRVTIENAKYPANDAVLTRMVPFAVSNETDGDDAVITTDGKLFVTMYFDK